MTTNSVLVAQPSSLPDKVKRLRAGQVIGERYELISLIGQGGMGEVWKAQARNRPNPVALKLLPPEFCSARQQQRMRERFSLVERLAHPNICTVMDLDVDAEIGPFLVMRYLEGITLAQYIQRQRGLGQTFQLQDVCHLLAPLASALDYAHDQGVVHRDIKPENVIIAEDGSHPVVVDFELAEQIRDTLTRQAVESLPEGTLAYLSPEAWRGKATNRQADQYALALIAYEMLSGELPFERSSRPDVLRQCTLSEPIPAIPQLHAANEILSKALAKDPQVRFSTCTDFIEDLRASSSSLSPGKRNANFSAGLLPGFLPDAQWISIAAALMVFFLITASWRKSNVVAEQTTPVQPRTPTEVSSDTPVVAKPQEPAPPAPREPTPLETEAIRARNDSMAERRSAEKTNAPEFAAAHWQTAQRHTNSADQALTGNDFSKAIVEYGHAADAYKLASVQAQQLANIASQMPAFQAELNQLHTQAEAARAMEFAREQLSVAESAAKRFAQFKQERAYQPALESYEESKTAYTQATEHAHVMCQVDESRNAFDQEVGKFEVGALDRFGGRAWTQARARIKAAQEPLKPQELIAAYREALVLLPGIKTFMRQNRLVELSKSGQHRQVLEELWHEYSQTTPELRATFLASAAAAPEWWFEKAEELARNDTISPATLSLLKTTMAQSAHILGKPFQTIIDDAEELASSIRTPLDALLTSFEIAQELAARTPDMPTSVIEKALVQVERDIKGLDSTPNGSEKSYVHHWIKNYIRLRCAAIYWRIGKREEADAISQMAYAANDPSRSFYYDLPAYQAVMIFADAGDWKRLAQMTVVRDGQLKLSHIEGQRPYRSLLSSSIGVAGTNHSESSNADLIFAFGHAEVALAAARCGGRDAFLVHYRRANELIEGTPPNHYRQLAQLLSSTLQSRMAIAEAQQQDFVSALGRLKGAIKERQPLGEAGVEIGRLQLRANSLDSRNVGIPAAKATLDMLADLPRSAALAREIAVQWAQSDLEQVVQWASDTKDDARKAAIMAGISSGLKLKKRDFSVNATMLTPVLATKHKLSAEKPAKKE